MNNFDKSRFLKMAEAAKKCENLVLHFLKLNHRLGFFLCKKEVQINGIKNGYHVPDIHNHKNSTTIEVKEDKSSKKTGNLCFEYNCIVNLKKWANAYNKKNMHLAYVNHHDYHIDFFQCGHKTDLLISELEWLCASDVRCKIVYGGDTNHKLYIIPIDVARIMHCNVTYEKFTHAEVSGFACIAKNILQ